MVKVRFAPSPTGHLHVGNLRVALFNYLFARKHGGDFILRIDDTDQERSSIEFENSIKDDLRKCGIFWNKEVRQSELTIEEVAKIKLDYFTVDISKEKLMSYPCYETPEELKEIIKAKNPYRFSDDKNTEPPLGGKPFGHYHRYQINQYEWDFDEEEKYDLSNVSDPVIIRQDGTPTYIFASFINDVFTDSITHIIRGTDHQNNTGLFYDMWSSMQENFPETRARELPEFHHLPFVHNDEGMGFSKRDGSLSVKEVLNEVSPETLIIYLYHLGLSTAPTGEETMDDLIRNFDLDNYGNSPYTFCMGELMGLERKRFKKLDFYDTEHMYNLRGVNPLIDDNFWELIKENCENYWCVAKWSNIIFKGEYEYYDDFTPEQENLLRAFVHYHREDESLKMNLDRAINAIGKQLVAKKTLRLALTGLETGPGLEGLVSYIEPYELRQRIQKNYYSFLRDTTSGHPFDEPSP